MSIKTSIKRNFLILLFLFLCSNIFAQTQYIDAKFFTNESSYKNSDSILIAAKIYVKDKYHINSYEVSDPTLIQTSVSSPSDNFTIQN